MASKLTFTQKFKAKLNRLDKVARNMVKDGTIHKSIISDIEKGVSPVQGQRFPKYSDYYKSIIRKGLGTKKLAPVNLKLTGDLLKSLSVSSISSRIIISFEDEKASWHNEGEGNLPRRAILPTRSKEVFNRKIRTVIQDALKKALGIVFRK